MKKYFLAAVVVLCLVPILFFPLSSDISIFIMAGKFITEGGKIYKDYVDLKPPFFYAFYAFIYKIFGDGEFCLRLFDFLWQTATVGCLYLFSKKIMSSRAALMASLAYALSYTTMGYNQTMNAESWVGLPLIIILCFLHEMPLNKSRQLIAILLLAVFTAMKYTFGLMFLAYLFIIFDWKAIGKSIKFSALSGLVFVTALAFCFFPLLDRSVWDGFVSVTRYLGFHSATPALNMQWGKSSTISTGVFFGDNFSLLFFGLLVLGFVSSMKNENYVKFKPTLIFMLALILSVIWERKFMVYHFSRAYLPFAILIGFGLDQLFTFIGRNIHSRDISKKLVIGIMSVFFILLSPVPRWLNLLSPIKYYFVDKSAFNNFYQIAGDNQNIRATYLEVANYLNTQYPANSKIIVVGIGANMINYFTPKMQHSKFTQSTFYFGSIQMPEWRYDILKEIKAADVLIIQKDDGAPILMGHVFSSMECMLADKSLTDVVNSRYEKTKTIKQFEVFRKIHYLFFE